ncbi:transposase [Neobacillus rhizosphaerae]|uniref:transposase n=1 Tax=Neobacillus rhizosphaerae TaxID=2880965 RepID=UPI003D280F0C
MSTTVSNQYSDEFKVAVVKDALRLNNISKAARMHSVHVNTVRKWKREYEEEISTGSTVLGTEERMRDIEQPDITNISVESEQQLKDLIHLLQNEIEQLTNINKQLQTEKQSFQQYISELQKELQSSQQYIGRMFMENERLKEKAIHCLQN